MNGTQRRTLSSPLKMPVVCQKAPIELALSSYAGLKASGKSVENIFYTDWLLNIFLKSCDNFLRESLFYLTNTASSLLEKIEAGFSVNLLYGPHLILHGPTSVVYDTPAVVYNYPYGMLETNFGKDQYWP